MRQYGRADARPECAGLCSVFHFLNTRHASDSCGRIAWFRFTGLIVKAIRDKLLIVTASPIIEEIKRLDPKEQLGVIRFAYQLDAERHLTGNELSNLAERMVKTTDPMEAAKVREAIVRGFYGQRDNA